MKKVSLKRDKRVDICLRGRLGNQLFQVASAMYLERRGFETHFDVSTLRDNNLEVAEISELSPYVKPRILKASYLLPRPFGKYQVLKQFLRYPIGYSSFYQDMTSTGKLPDFKKFNHLIDGYWQRYEYTEELAEYLKESYLLNENDTQAARAGTLAIHVRRGDYVSLGLALPETFYKNAIHYISSRVNVTKIQIYSDDSLWCVQNLKNLGIPTEYSINKSVLDDFKELASANYQLISRSTYSWWSARLSNGLIFYPSPFFDDQNDLDNAILGPSWIPIKV